MTKKSQELIKIEFTKVDRKLVQTVDARELHKDLDSKKKFTHWIKIQLKLFTENKDYIIFSDFQGTKNTHSEIGKKRHGHIKADYFLTLDTAKHIGMMSRTARGMELRQYFIDQESDYRDLRERLAGNKSDTDCQLGRAEGKVARRKLTDVIKIFIEYARAQGSSQPQMYYQNISKLSNQLFIFNEYIKNRKDKRDYLEPEQHGELKNIEEKLAQTILVAMEEKKPYKTIYLLCKDKVERYIDIFGKTNVIRQLEQAQYSLLS